MGDKNMACGLSENFEFLINELSSRQKEQQKATSDLVSAVNNSTRKIENIDRKVEHVFSEHFKKLEESFSKNVNGLNGTNLSVDTSSLTTILQKGIVDLKLALSAYPKNVTTKNQILLFPERYADAFHKIIFKRAFLLLIASMLLFLGYKWMIHREDNNKELTIEALKNERATKAWDYLYNHGTKVLRKQMDSVMRKADTLSH